MEPSSPPIIDRAQPTTLADQSQSRLMTLPRELRNKIYEFVFCDNSTYVHEPIAYEWDFGDLNNDYYYKFRAEKAHLPRAVRLDYTTPPSKDYILPCRALYYEMKHMQAVAYCDYWIDNRFLYSDAEMLDLAALPADKDMTRIEEFVLVLHPKYNLRIVFEDLEWGFWLLPADGKMRRIVDIAPHWFMGQDGVQDAVLDYLMSIASSSLARDPRAGQGFNREMIVAISRLEGVREAIQELIEVEDIAPARGVSSS